MDDIEESGKVGNDFYRRDTLCTTLSNRPCEILTITDNISTYLSSGEEKEYYLSNEPTIDLNNSQEKWISEIPKNPPKNPSKGSKSSSKSYQNSSNDPSLNLKPDAFKKISIHLEKALKSK